MKANRKNLTTTLASTVAAALTALAAGCGDAQGEAPSPALARAAFAEEASGAPMEVLPTEASADGRSQIELSEDFQRYNYSIPAADHPALNPAADCNAGQSGRVFNAPLFPFSGVLSARTCQVPQGEHVFFTVTGVFNDFPCPDPTFVPPPGESLEDFLREGAIAGNSRFIPGNFELLVDGEPIDIAAHRITTPLFGFVGDPSLSIPSFDVCVTGETQVGVFDGYQILIAPPSPGEHTIVLRSKISGRMRTMTLDVTPNDPQD